MKTLYVGYESVTKNKIQRDIATDFYRKLHAAYVTAAVYSQKKYALNNPLLNFFYALDPRSRQSSLMHENLLNLKPYFETFLSSGCGEYSSEIKKYDSDSELLLPEEKIDVWLNKVFKTNRYPVLSSLVCHCLSIFMGRMVKCSLSMINIIDSRWSHIEIETYSSIMTAKYSLKSSESVALKFSQKGILWDPVDSTLLYYMHAFHHIKNAWKLSKIKCCCRKKTYCWKKCFQE